ncbi:MAG: TetR/AcrR family transcriptional regulator [Methylocystis sp.]
MSNPREKVVDAALVLATRRDYGDVTLSDIAHEANISLAELRDLFPSKGAIVGGFLRRIDRQILQEQNEIHHTEPMRERLYEVLKRRLLALQPYRDSILSIKNWVSRDPLMQTALNREVINSMRFMLEAAEIESDGTLGAVKLQGLVFVWWRVIDVWLEKGLDEALHQLNQQLSRGEQFVSHAEQVISIIQPVRDFFGKFMHLDQKSHHVDDDIPHPKS